MVGQDCGWYWCVFVYYGGEVGMDLVELVVEKGMMLQVLIDLYSGVCFCVFMIGFVFGFVYLGGLFKVLYMLCLKVLCQCILVGVVGIGGQQGSISLVVGLLGWWFLGGMLVRLFDFVCDLVFLLMVGDIV